MMQPKYKKIVVPVDLSEPVTRSIDVAIEMGGKGVEIHLVHVVVPTSTLISIDPAIPFPPTHESERLANARERLKNLPDGEKYFECRQHCVTGDPATEITGIADSIDADLIVMPSHGRTGLKRMILGSVAEKVLRLSKCPVLILRDG